LPEYVWQFVGYAPDGKLYGTTSRVAPKVGEWAHLAGVWEGNNLCLYVNGGLHYKLAVPDGLRAPKAGEPFFTGPPPPQARGFRGEINEIRLSKIARYTANFMPERRFKADADTLALYHLDEGQGSVVGDSSGNGRQGTIVGAKWVQAVRPMLPGQRTFSLEFDGIDDRVDVPQLPFDPERPFTWEMVARPYGVDTMSLLLGVGLASKSQMLMYRRYPSSPASWSMNNMGAVASVPAADLETVHLAGVYDGKIVRMFVNGQQLQQENVQAERPGGSTSRLLIGCGEDGRSPFHGRVDFVRISNVARYAADFTPPTRIEPDKNTLALYRFEEGQGDVLKDSSGNGHHGKIVGAKWVGAPSSPDR
jgi:hypothetical protein